MVTGAVPRAAARDAPRRSDAGTVRLTGRDATGLLLVAEHYAVPYDLLAAALGVRPARLRLESRQAYAGAAHVPDAEIHWPGTGISPHAGQVWAVEAELTPKPAARTARIMHGLLFPPRYAQVVYLLLVR